MYKDKKSPFKSVCLNVDTAFITAWSNDDSFDNIFSRQLESLAQSGDILIALSTSGNSKNIINAVQYCSKNDIKIISLTGFDGGLLKDYSDINISWEAAAPRTPRSELSRFAPGPRAPSQEKATCRQAK